MLFATPRTGYSLEVSLPTNGYIDRLETRHLYGEPASNLEIDFASDGDVDWSFPKHQGRGHFGWQTNLLDTQTMGTSQGTKSIAMNVGSTPSSAYAVVPTSGYVNTGVYTVYSDSDGFESPVHVNVSGVSQSTGSQTERFTSELNSYQISSINSLPSGWSDTATERDWRVVEISLTSSHDQVVTLTGLALGTQYSKM